MNNLESRVDVPFKLGTYHFDLVWKGFHVGTSSLSFSKVSRDAVPGEAQKFSNDGDVYKVIFDGVVTVPIIERIAKSGVFVSYIVVKNNDAHPLLSFGEAFLLGRKSSMTCVYDYAQNGMTINGRRYVVDTDKMQLLRDPVSHVVNLLFRQRKTTGKYSCGYFADETGTLRELVFDFSVEKGMMIGRGTIPAKAYVLDTSVDLELPYSFDAEKQMFIPSLTERVAVSHRWLGKVILDYKKFIKAQK